MGAPPGNAPRDRAKPLVRRWQVVGRYTLFQLPEMTIVGIALVLGVEYGVVSELWARVLFGVWILKEIALFPFVRAAYEPVDPNVASALIGRRGVVTRRLDPDGSVRIGPELWRARVDADRAPLDPGLEVCVKSVEGLTLHVDLVSGD